MLVPRPSYPLFEHLTRLDLVSAIPYDLEYHGAWSIDLASVERAMTPRTRALLLVSLSSGIGLGATYLAGWRIADLLPFSTSSFIATYVLSMAAAVRLLRPPLRYGAAVALLACVVVLLFTGALVAWIAAVTGVSLLYTRSVGERRRDR